MPFQSIWERYFLKELLKVFFLFLFGFYGLYVLIDYSTHSRSFKNYHFSFSDIASFYGNEFVLRMDILIPFALLIACIKTLCMLNTHNELVALMAGGINLKRLMRPFILFGIACTLLTYFNSEVLQPKALKYHKKLHQIRSKEKRKKHHHPHIQQFTLEDNSSLIFQSFDEANHSFFDAYWVLSIDDIYRIRHLFLYDTAPLGKFVEHLQRDAKGILSVVESFEEKTFPEIHINNKKLAETVVSPTDQSLSELRKKLVPHGDILSEKEARLQTTYYHKLAIPWLCLLAIMAPVPFCTRFSRTLPVFYIYALGLFGLVAFYLTMDAAVVLGERQVLAPAVAIWVPFGLLGAIVGWRYARL